MYTLSPSLNRACVGTGFFVRKIMVLWACLITVYPIPAHAQETGLLNREYFLKTYGAIYQMAQPEVESRLRNANSQEHLSAPEKAYLEASYQFLNSFTQLRETGMNQTRIKAQHAIDLLSPLPENPWKILMLSDLQFMMGTLDAEQGNYFSSALHMNKCFKGISRGMDKYPGFVPYLKIAGLKEILMASIPPDVKWAFTLIGYSGNINKGFTYLDSLSKLQVYHQAFSVEAVSLYVLMRSQIQDDNEAAYLYLRKWINKKGYVPATRYLEAYLCVKTRRNDKAIQNLENLIEDQEKGYENPQLQYHLGKCYLYKGDEAAVKALRWFWENGTDCHHRADAALALSWYYRLYGSYNKAEEWLNKCLSLTAVSEKDKYAQSLARSQPFPDADLLQARLYYDGGYYQKGIQVLEGKEGNYADRPELQEECYYRMARLYQATRQTPLALRNYLSALKLGESRNTFHAANSALQMAMIMESLGRKDMARHYYRRCLSMKGYPYENGIKSQAKTGLARVE